MTRIPTAAQLERLIDEVRPILDRVPQLIRQANEWADEGVKGVDPGKVNVRGGSITNPTEAAALKDTRCQWGEMARRLKRDESTVEYGITANVVWWAHRYHAIDAHVPESAPSVARLLTDWRDAAEQLIADARAIDHRHHETDRKTKNELTEENSVGGPCQWCGRRCGSGDDRRKRVGTGRSAIGLCSACYQFLLRRWPEGVPMSDSAYHDEINAARERGEDVDTPNLVKLTDRVRKERDQYLADKAARKETA